MIHWLWLIPAFLFGLVCGVCLLFVAVRVMVRRVEKDIEKRREMQLGELIAKINRQHTAN